MHSWPREAVPHPLAALGAAEDTFRVNPLYDEVEPEELQTEEPCRPRKEDQISVSSESHSDTKETTSAKGRPTSISSGYGSTATEDVAPILTLSTPKVSPMGTLVPLTVWPMDAMEITRRTLLQLAEAANSAASIPADNSRNKIRQNYDGQLEEIRLRLKEALDQLSKPIDLERDGCRCITYTGLEVKAGDVKMKAKPADIRAYSSLGRFTLDKARSDILARRLAAARRRRCAWRCVVALGAVALLIASVAAAELALSSGRRLFGVFL